MLPSTTYIVSDLHLGHASGTLERQFCDFLEAAGPGMGALVVYGDLFDFWFEWRHVIPRAGFRALAAIARLADRGVPVLWIAGNHDCWGGEVLRRTGACLQAQQGGLDVLEHAAARISQAGHALCGVRQAGNHSRPAPRAADRLLHAVRAAARSLTRPNFPRGVE